MGESEGRTGLRRGQGGHLPGGAPNGASCPSVSPKLLGVTQTKMAALLSLHPQLRVAPFSPVTGWGAPGPAGAVAPIQSSKPVWLLTHVSDLRVEQFSPDPEHVAVCVGACVQA